MMPVTLHSSIMESKINLPKLGPNQEITISLNTHLPWVQSILEELNSGLDEEANLALEERGNLEIELTLKKKWDTSYQDCLTVKGLITSQYTTQCTKCLQPMQLALNIPLEACFISETYENHPELQDQTAIYILNQEWDLYFFSRKEVDLYPFLREQIFLNMDNFPLHADDCKGLCQHCGVNLNNEHCSHALSDPTFS